MKNFVKATKEGGQPIWLNLNRVKYMEKSQAGGSYILLGRGDYLIVHESPEEVLS